MPHDGPSQVTIEKTYSFSKYNLILVLAEFLYSSGETKRFITV